MTFQKGNQLGKLNKGKKRLPLTKEHKKKISLGNKGKIMSEEAKMRISKANKGKKKTEKQKKEQSKRCKELGFIPPSRRGAKMSEEARRKISEARKGDKCFFWKGGITPKNLKIRMGLEFRLWRETVFARDTWTCQKCGDDKGGNLNPHHIKNFAQYPELRFAIDNGITFCQKCHKKFHKTYKYKNNTKEQLEEFLMSG